MFPGYSSVSSESCTSMKYLRLVLITIMLSVGDNSEINSCATPPVNGQCQSECPSCALGTGLTEFCGLGTGEGVECEICLTSQTFSKKQSIGDYDYYTCESCTRCDSYLRETDRTCTIYQDAKCGVCLRETYGVEPPSRPEIPLYSCHPCSETERNSETQCEEYWNRIDKELEEAQKDKEWANTVKIIVAVTIGCILVLILVIVGYLKRNAPGKMCRMCSKKAEQEDEIKNVPEMENGAFSK